MFQRLKSIGWLTASALSCVLVLAGAQVVKAQTSAQTSTQTSVQMAGAPRVDALKDTTAEIVWRTNVGASAVVKYGTDRNNLNQTAQQEWGGRETRRGTNAHHVKLQNLQPGTTYYYQVESGQAEGTGTAVKGDVASFTTLTKEAAAQQSTNNSNTTSAAVQITDGPKVEFVADKTAVIAWTTNVAASSVVRYGTDRNNLNESALQEWGGTANDNGARTHRVEIKNLKANTPYFFVVESGQAQGTGTTAKSEVTALTTLTAEAAAEAYKQKQNASNTLKIQAGPVPQSVKDVTASLWLMTSEDAPVVVKYGTDRNNLNLTAQSPTGKTHTISLASLQPSTTYFYEVNAGDGKAVEKGQFQTENANFAAEKSRVHLTKGPVIEYVTRRNAIVAWSTNVRSSSIVRYGTDPNNLNQTAQAPWGQETHRVEIKNLRPDTKYYFVVESAQAEGSGTLAKSNSAPFTTVGAGQQAMRNQQPQ
ncbi:MAG TPA: fibronectin type III domain-containing protein [Terriglobales bacterium]|nr:fibronectin type III domain-containing protein [Terriglobales bacterium]